MPHRPTHFLIVEASRELGLEKYLQLWLRYIHRPFPWFHVRLQVGSQYLMPGCRAAICKYLPLASRGRSKYNTCTNPQCSVPLRAAGRRALQQDNGKCKDSPCSVCCPVFFSDSFFRFLCQLLHRSPHFGFCIAQTASIASNCHSTAIPGCSPLNGVVVIARTPI